VHSAFPTAATTAPARVGVTCRLCSSPLRHVVTDLGATPLANAYLRPENLNAVEPYYPLRLLFCSVCLLAQLDFVADPRQIFSALYPYFSSVSTTLLRESQAFASAMADRLPLRRGDRVVEIASNDGYLLQYFVEQGMDVLGIEPSGSVAEAALNRGIPTKVDFFGTAVAAELVRTAARARLIVANNVLAHVPDINDFLAGVRLLLAPAGLVSLEFHHLLNLVQKTQFDNIYHEHFQYFSLASARNALAHHGLAVVDVEEIPAQGGSLRVYARHEAEAEAPSARVGAVLAAEEAAGLDNPETYATFGERIRQVKLGLLKFLIDARHSGHSVVAHGAAAKGNTLLNSCGAHPDLIDYVVDSSPHKQGMFMPGSRIPIHAPARVAETKPDYLLILPWNLRDEIITQMAHIREWGGRFVVPVPELQIIP
jgi:SAM-dependent methyltransferase